MRNILRKPFSLLAVVSCLGLVMALSLGCGGGGDTTSSTVPTNGAPRITVDLGAQSSVTVGADLTLVVEATGTPAPAFQWRKSGQPLAGQTAKSLTLKSVQMSENGATYDVVVSNTVGSVTSSTTTLQVKAAPSANDISGVDSTGTAVKLSDYKGSVILLDISAEWCPPCNADAVPLEQLYQKYKVRGLKVLTVLAQNNSGDIPSTQALQNWVNKGLTYRVMNDTTGATPGQGVAQTVYVRQTGGFPTFVVIDKDFSVQYIQGGFSQSRIEAKVEELLSK